MTCWLRGCIVVRVPAQLMAAARRAGRQPGKSDPIDALAVAHAALREPGLPAARLDGPAREVKLLSDHRHNLVTERTILCQPAALAPARTRPRAADPAPAACAATASWTTSTARLRAFDGVVARIAARAGRPLPGAHRADQRARTRAA